MGWGDTAGWWLITLSSVSCGEGSSTLCSVQLWNEVGLLRLQGRLCLLHGRNGPGRLRCLRVLFPRQFRLRSLLLPNRGPGRVLYGHAFSWLSLFCILGVLWVRGGCAEGLFAYGLSRWCFFGLFRSFKHAFLGCVRFASQYGKRLLEVCWVGEDTNERVVRRANDEVCVGQDSCGWGSVDYFDVFGYDFGREGEFARPCGRQAGLKAISNRISRVCLVFFQLWFFGVD